MTASGAGVSLQRMDRAETVAVGRLVVGDQLDADASPLAVWLGLRVRGALVEPTRPALARAYPGPSGKLAVFVHGLGETEHAWMLGGRRTYGERLRTDAGWTALEVRYNTGLPVERNGRELAALLEAVCARWPVDVAQLALVGHWMGGLVACAALRAGADDELAFVEHATHVICLATPHGGAPLAKGCHVMTRALGRLPEAAAVAGRGPRMPAGIDDLRHGPDIAHVEGVAYRYLAATVAHGGRDPLAAEHVDVVGGAHHIRVLNDERVYAQLRRRLEAPE